MRTGTVNAHVGNATTTVDVPSSQPSSSGMARLAGVSERMFGVDLEQGDGVRGGISQNAARSIKIFAAMVAVFFIVVATVAVVVIGNRHTEAEQARLSSDVRSLANDVSSTLDAAVAWTDTALAARSPAQAVNIAVRGENAAAAAWVVDKTVVSAQPPAQGAVLGQLRYDVQAAPGSVQVVRIVAENGEINPVIVRATGDGYLLLALATGTLLPNPDDSTILVSSTGLVVDGPVSAARQGIQALGLDTTSFRQHVNLATSGHVAKWSLSGEDGWIATAKLPGEGLSVVKVAERSSSPLATPLILIFLILFAGTAVLIKAMMNQALTSLQNVQHSFREDEVKRQRYQAIVDGMGGGIFEIDLVDKEVFLTEPLVKLLGLGESDRYISLSDTMALLHEDSRETFYNQVRRAHMSGEFACDIQIRHLPIVLSCQGQPLLRSEDGDSIPTRKFIVGIATNVTEQRGAQARLQAAEARLFDALRSMTDAFVLWDPLDRLVLWNARFEDFFGFQPGNLRPGLERATVEYYAQERMESSTTDANGSVEILLKDGRWLRYLETATQDGGRVSISTDVTEIRAREQMVRDNNLTLERQYETLSQTQTRLLDLAKEYEREKIRAEEANQSKSEFLANMSHELRTPLNAINGFSDIMQKEMFGPLGDPRYKEYVNDILFSGKHLLSLINDILDMSKIEAGKMSLNTDSVSVGSLIEQVVRIVRGRAEENRLSLVYAPVETQVIEADPRAIKQVLLNLIGNAIKFTPEGGTVEVVVDPRKQGIIVHVRDSGMGISEDDLARLAQPFEQASNNKSGEGTGLGLALSKSLVELHGGNFNIASKLGEGTTITFTLPNRPIPKAREVAKTAGVSAEISRLADTISTALERGRHVQAAEPVAPQSPTPPQPAPQPAAQPQVYTPPAA